MTQKEPTITKQLISKLLELDPDGNRLVYVCVAADGYYNSAVYNNEIEIDDTDDSIVITLPFDEE